MSLFSRLFHSYRLRLPTVFPLLILTGLLRAGETDGVLPPRPKVLIIGIDGVRPDALRAAEAPHLLGLASRGAVTWDAFAGGHRGTPSQQVTSSGPGWSSILTGVWTDKHGVTDNSFSGNHFHLYPHFFQRLKSRAPEVRTASIVSWVPIDVSIVGPVDGATDHRFQGQGSDYRARDASVVANAEDHLLHDDPDVLFIHFDQVDGAGHSNGYGAGIPSYLAAISNVDAHVGRLIAALEARPNHDDEDWLVIVTTDHGGLGTGHGGQTPDERTIFLIVSGGEARPRELEFPAGHTAVPATALQHLGIEIDPDWGWDPPFGIPPYPPAAFQAVEDTDRQVLLTWEAPEDSPDMTEGVLELRRDGIPIAELPTTASRFIDRPPRKLFASSGEYLYDIRLRTEDRTSAPAAIEIALLEEPSLSLAVDLPLDGDLEDRSGNGNDGRGQGPLTYHPDARGGLALSTRAGHAVLPSAADLEFGRFRDFSLSFSLLRSAGTGDSPAFVVGSRGTGAGTEPGWAVFVREGFLHLLLADGQNRAVVRAQIGNMTDWTHVVVSASRLGRAEIHIDGQPAAEGSLESVRDIDTLQAVHLGAAPDQSGSNYPGWIDSLRIWSRALSARDAGHEYDRASGAKDWRDSHFTALERILPQVAGWDADPDGDGLTNLEELAHGGRPRIPDPGLVPLQILHREGRIHLRFRRPADGWAPGPDSFEARGLRISIQASVAGRQWSDVSDAFDYAGLSTATPGSARWQSLVSRSPIAELSFRFFRLHTEF